jgi:predicted nucleic acid-binding protein
VAEQPAYFDTSAILPLYRSEPATELAEKALASRPAVISALVEVEVASALARWVRMDELTDHQARDIEIAFAGDLRDGQFERTEMQPQNYWRAREWLTQRSTPLRTLDALHLACANQTGLTIVTGDKVLADAARSLDQPVQLLEP